MPREISTYREELRFETGAEVTGVCPCPPILTTSMHADLHLHRHQLCCFAFGRGPITSTFSAYVWDRPECQEIKCSPGLPTSMTGESGYECSSDPSSIR